MDRWVVTICGGGGGGGVAAMAVASAREARTGRRWMRGVRFLLGSDEEGLELRDVELERQVPWQPKLLRTRLHCVKVTQRM